MEYKEKDPYGIVREFMKEESWGFKEQIGAGLVIKRDEEVRDTNNDILNCPLYLSAMARKGE